MDLHATAASTRSGRTSGFSLTIVVPCFNEQEVIRSTYHRLADVLSGERFGLRMIFVDDGSVDGTGVILREIADRDSRVRVVTLSRNFGQQAAVSIGLAHSDGDATIIIDADLQDPPELIPRMLELWADGYDVVYGVRTHRAEAYWKTFSYRLFYRLFRLLASMDTPLDAGDFSLLDRGVVAEINRLPEKNRFFRGLRAWVGFRQIGLAYQRNPRQAGVTKYTLTTLVKLATDGIFNFSTAPLSLVFYMGIGISALTFLMAIAVLVLRITGIPILGVRINDVQGFASTIILMLFIGGVQLVSIGILGEYIGRIYQEVKARPTAIAHDATPASVDTPPAAYGAEDPGS